MPSSLAHQSNRVAFRYEMSAAQLKSLYASLLLRVHELERLNSSSSSTTTSNSTSASSSSSISTTSSGSNLMSISPAMLHSRSNQSSSSQSQSVVGTNSDDSSPDDYDVCIAVPTCVFVYTLLHSHARAYTRCVAAIVNDGNDASDGASIGDADTTVAHRDRRQQQHRRIASHCRRHGTHLAAARFVG